MFRIKRTKAGAIHFATLLDKSGNVSGWTRERGTAALFTVAEVETAETFQTALGSEQRKNAGQLQREPVSQEEIEAAAAAQQEPDSVADLVACAVEAAFQPFKDRLKDQFREHDQRLAALENRIVAPLAGVPAPQQQPKKSDK